MARRVSTGTRPVPRTYGAIAGSPVNRKCWKASWICGSRVTTSASGPTASSSRQRQSALGQAPRRIQLGAQLLERRNVSVALDHGGDIAKSADGRRIQLPDRIRHRVIMGIDQIVAVILMPGQVNLLDPLDGDGVEIFQRIEFVVHAADIDVVHIE